MVKIIGPNDAEILSHTPSSKSNIGNETNPRFRHKSPDGSN